MFSSCTKCPILFLNSFTNFPFYLPKKKKENLKEKKENIEVTFICTGSLRDPIFQVDPDPDVTDMKNGHDPLGIRRATHHLGHQGTFQFFLFSSYHGSVTPKIRWSPIQRVRIEIFYFFFVFWRRWSGERGHRVRLLLLFLFFFSWRGYRLCERFHVFRERLALPTTTDRWENEPPRPTKGFHSNIPVSLSFSLRWRLILSLSNAQPTKWMMNY